MRKVTKFRSTVLESRTLRTQKSSKKLNLMHTVSKSCIFIGAIKFLLYSARPRPPVFLCAKFFKRKFITVIGNFSFN